MIGVGAGWPAWLCASTARNWWAPSSKPAILRVFYIGTNSPHADVMLLETRSRGYVIRGAKDSRLPNLSFALLDAAFGPDRLCLSEAGGPVRCVDCRSGSEIWRYVPPKETHTYFACVIGQQTAIFMASSGSISAGRPEPYFALQAESVGTRSYASSGPPVTRSFVRTVGMCSLPQPAR